MFGRGGLMGERDVPEELAALDKELAGVTRQVERRIDPSPAAALVVAVAMFALLGGLLLPWSGTALGWEVLAGLRPIGPLPRLFTFTSLGFGLVVSALALGTRWWGLAWLAAFGCGFSVVHGVWAIWSRQTAVPHGIATGPGIGMILAAVAVLVLAASWVRIALRR
jgi:hypothetical protein